MGDDQSMSPPNVETSQPELPVEEETEQEPGDHELEGENDRVDQEHVKRITTIFKYNKELSLAV
jgi:hypothetical protein